MRRLLALLVALVRPAAAAYVCECGTEVTVRSRAGRRLLADGWSPSCPGRGCGGPPRPVTGPSRDEDSAMRAIMRAAMQDDSPDMTKAAPGRNPGRPIPPATTRTTNPERTDVHTLPMEQTAQGRQLLASFALAHVLRTELPIAEWRITAHGRLHGHIALPAGYDKAALDAMCDYAQFLGTTIQRTPTRNDRSQWTHLQVAATYRDVAVQVWTLVDLRPATPHGGQQS